MIIEKQAELEQERIRLLEKQSNLIAPDGKLYKHKYLDFITPNKYVRFQTYYFLLGKPLTKERIKEFFEVDQEPPYKESERDYELIDESDPDFKDETE